MFHLVIDYQATIDITAHPSREVALGELLKFLDKADCDYRVTQATWEHSSYALLHRAQVDDMLETGRCGQAVIEEICGCQHTNTEHDESGCLAQILAAGQVVGCGCPAYRPITGEPALFDIHSPAGAQPDDATPMQAAS